MIKHVYYPEKRLLTIEKDGKVMLAFAGGIAKKRYVALTNRDTNKINFEILTIKN